MYRIINLDKDGCLKTHEESNGSLIATMNEVIRFSGENACNLRHQNTFRVPALNLVFHSTEDVSFLEPRILRIYTTSYLFFYLLGALKVRSANYRKFAYSI